VISRWTPCYYAELLDTLAEALLGEATLEAESLTTGVAEAIIIESLAIDPLTIGALESLELPHDEPLHPPHDEPLQLPEDPLEPP